MNGSVPVRFQLLGWIAISGLHSGRQVKIVQDANDFAMLNIISHHVVNANIAVYNPNSSKKIGTYWRVRTSDCDDVEVNTTYID